MTSIQDHYDQHLGPVYSWMVGGVNAAVRRGAQEIEDLASTPSKDALAVDLGAGFGMHAIPLARKGFHVVAIDTCAALLEELRRQQGELPIDPIHGDLQSFRKHLPGTPELILCLGDTLPHLPNTAAVDGLFHSVAAALTTGGRFVVTLRDYSTPLTGEQRFIAVRSDRERVFTCFLEYHDSHVMVHDLLHEYTGSHWELRISTYPKLRLSPSWVVARLQENGFVVDQGRGPSGMIRLIAQRI